MSNYLFVPYRQRLISFLKKEKIRPQLINWKQFETAQTVCKERFSEYLCDEMRDEVLDIYAYDTKGLYQRIRVVFLEDHKTCSKFVGLRASSSASLDQLKEMLRLPR